ncbi:MAG: DUF1802 family protein [Chthoniobacterales bacterium]
MESVGFKEWAIVCDAIGRGEQSIILRKGGIAEGREGFTFRHTEFFLFPTQYHEQLEKTRGAERDVPRPRAGEIDIVVLAKVEFSGVITSWETATALEPFHIWRRKVVRERFDYDKAPGIHFAFLRAHELSHPWIIPELPVYGGCRSWVNLRTLPNDISFAPVLSDAAHATRAEEVKRIVAQDVASTSPSATAY